jgi:hypothetical protein
MAKAHEVLSFLIPTGGWIMTGDTFEGIEFLECNPITKAQFEAGFAQVDAKKQKQKQKPKQPRQRHKANSKHSV